MRMYTVLLFYLLHSVKSAPLLTHNNDELSLDDIFISVKTTGKYHKSRLTPILDTWFSLAPSSTWIFSDTSDPELSRRTGGHLINTGCPSDHSRSSLCCKMETEMTTFLKESSRSWFCHLDDDNRSKLPEEKTVRFLFGTGGAGFCLSRPLLVSMLSKVAGIATTGDNIRLPDDVTVGYIAEVIMGVPLTQVDTLHSHLESLRRVDKDMLEDQVTLSYSTYEDGEKNAVGLEGIDFDKDPTTFYTIHCKLFNQTCDKM